MSNSPWYKRWTVGLARSLTASIGWSLFTWATGYKGFVCDWAERDPLPCVCWFQEMDSKKGPQ